MLQARDVTVAYGDFVAVAGASLEIGPGESVFVVGANGAGKTTLLSAIAGLVPIRSGEVTIDGTKPRRTATGAIERGIALVPEGRRVFAPLTVEENLELGGYVRLRRGERSEVERDKERMMERFPSLHMRRQQPAGRLSGGEQQMLAIARALMSRPRYLLLDEPTMGLAPMIVDEIGTHLEALVREGTGILIAEENARFAFAHATRGYVLEGGRVVAKERTDSIAIEGVTAAFFGPR